MNLQQLVQRPIFLRSFTDWDSIRKTRIGITGHRGLLGSLLSERFKAQGLDYAAYEGDVTDEESFANWLKSNQPQALFHLAAVVPTQRVLSDPTKAMHVNATSLLTIAKATPPASDTWIFFASSSHVYCSGPGELSETSPTAPQTLYGATKLAGERILTPLMEQAGVKLCVGRIFSYFHERQPQEYLIPNLIHQILQTPSGEFIKVRDSDAIRDFLHADMVVDAILSLFERRHSGTINIASGQAASVGEIAQRVITMSKKNIRMKPLASQRPTRLVADISLINSILTTKTHA